MSLSDIVNIVMFMLSMFGFSVFIIAAFKVFAMNKKLSRTNQLLEELVRKK